MKKNLVISSVAAIAALNPEGFTVNAANLQPVTTGFAVALKRTQNSFGNEGLEKVASVIDELVKMVLKECNISPDDTSSWAKDIRTIIKYSIEHFDEEMEEDEVDPDEENRLLSGQYVGDAIEIQSEAFYVANGFVPHTFEEMKAEYIRQGCWESFLNMKGMTEAEYKEYRDKRYAQGDEA